MILKPVKLAIKSDVNSSQISLSLNMNVSPAGASPPSSNSKKPETNHTTPRLKTILVLIYDYIRAVMSHVIGKLSAIVKNRNLISNKQIRVLSKPISVVSLSNTTRIVYLERIP